MTAFDPSAAAAADSGIFGLPFSTDEAKVVVLPVPWGATTSYGAGAELGPRAVLEASKQVDLFDVDTGRPYEAKIAMLGLASDPALAIARMHAEARPLAASVIAGITPAPRDALDRVNALSAEVNALVYDTTRALLEQGKLVALLGGDHSAPFGAIRAIALAHPGVGILHVDAHADLRVAYEGFTDSHASIMHNVASRVPEVGKIVQVGIRDFSEDELRAIDGSGGRIVTHFDRDLAAQKAEGEPWAVAVKRIVLDLPKDVYISFDIDGLDPVLCPHTGTPVPGGLSFHEAMALLGAVGRSGRRIVGVDLNEVVPGADGDEWDGNVGSRILYKMIGWMLASQGLIEPRR